MWKLALALLFTPALVMVGAPTKSVKTANAAHEAQVKTVAHSPAKGRVHSDFTVGSSAHAAVYPNAYPAVSAKAFALVTSH